MTVEKEPFNIVEINRMKKENGLKSFSDYTILKNLIYRYNSNTKLYLLLSAVGNYTIVSEDIFYHSGKLILNKYDEMKFKSFVNKHNALKRRLANADYDMFALDELEVINDIQKDISYNDKVLKWLYQNYSEELIVL